MKNVLLFLLIFLLGTDVGAWPFNGKGIKGGVEGLLKCVVVVSTDDSGEEDVESDDSSSQNEKFNGAGIIVDKSGIIITNCHVIDSSDRIKVETYDKREYSAEVIGKDSRFDIAVLRIKTDKNSNLTPCKFGDSSKVRVGDSVLAVGHLLNFKMTATSGIVSYCDRDLSEQITKIGAEGDLVSAFIQTDALIGTGNSGGPLFNEFGEVIGMVTIFMTGGERPTGPGFAIPSNLINKLLKQLTQYGKVPRSWLGLIVSRMSPEVSRILLNRGIGYYVSAVSDNSPAKAAKFLPGDVLLSINNEQITEKTNVGYLLNNLVIDSVIPVQILRNGQKIMLSVHVGTGNEDEYQFTDDDDAGKELSYEKVRGLDFGVSEITDELRRVFHYSPEESGVIVSFADPRNVNLNVGCLIKSVNGESVNNVEAFKSRVLKNQKAKRNYIVLCIKDLSKKISYVSIPCR